MDPITGLFAGIAIFAFVLFILIVWLTKTGRL